MKITLIRPPVLMFYDSFSTHAATLPIGLAYVAAAVRERGHKVFIIDAAGEALGRCDKVSCSIGTLMRQGLSSDEVVDRIPADAQAVGITHMYLHEWPMIRELSEKIKKRHPSMTVILGGENATAFWKRIFEETDAVDYCVLGEGEQTILTLLDGLESGHTDLSQEGVVAYKRGPSQAVVAAPRIVDSTLLPWPAWDLFPVDNYLLGADALSVNRGRSMPILASRGCPYDCTFCSGPSMWTRCYVSRPPEDVVSEIKSYVERYGIDNVNFCDLTLVLRKEWIMEFCAGLAGQPFHITWQLPVGIRPQIMDLEAFRRMYAAGCRNITFSPDSGSERMQKVLRKKVKLSKMLDAIRAARKAGLITRVNIIIGHSQERLRDIYGSLLFLIRAAWIGVNDAYVIMFSPYPGCEDTNKLIEQGRLRWAADGYYFALMRAGNSSRTYNPQMGTRSLVFLQYCLATVFYIISYLSRPWRLLLLLKNFCTGRESTNVDHWLHTKFNMVRSRQNLTRVV